MAYNKFVVYDSVAKTLSVPKLGNALLPFAITMFGDLHAVYQTVHQWKLLDMDRASAVYPTGITIVSWYLDCAVASPTTQLTANLKYCDSVGSGAFPGANPVVVDSLNSTAGHASRTDMSSSTLGSGVIPAGKLLYIDMGADPTDTNTLWSLVINFTLT